MIDIGLFVLRAFAGMIFIIHGLPKLKDPMWASKMGFSKTIGMLVG